MSALAIMRSLRRIQPRLQTSGQNKARLREAARGDTEGESTEEQLHRRRGKFFVKEGGSA